MEFVPFREILPAIAKKETRALLVLQETHGLPKGDYVFSDSYCSDPHCDCRRTFINVLCVKGELEGRQLATIGYGWETLKFYTQWMHGDRETAKRMTGVGLEGMQVQSDYAPQALHAFRRLVCDEPYEERIRRHYAAFKGEIRRREAADSPFEASGPKAGRNDPCPCGSGKKYKKCCDANRIAKPSTATSPDAALSKDANAALITRLFSEADRLPRDVVDACIQNGEQLVPTLTAIVRDTNNWRSDEARWWAAIHATFILGAIGGVSAVPGLLAALRNGAAYECDFVTEAMSSIFGSIGSVALHDLRSIAEDRSNDWYVRATACDCLTAIALHEEGTQGSIFPFLADIFTDPDEERVLRELLGLTLLQCRRREYRDDLMNFAQEEEEREGDSTEGSHRPDDPYGMHFDTKDVLIDLAEAEPDRSSFEQDWLMFYDEQAIRDRQKRWKREHGLWGWISIRLFRIRLWFERPRMRRFHREFEETRKRRVQEILEQEERP